MLSSSIALRHFKGAFFCCYCSFVPLCNKKENMLLMQEQKATKKKSTRRWGKITRRRALFFLHFYRRKLVNTLLCIRYIYCRMEKCSNTDVKAKLSNVHLLEVLLLIAPPPYLCLQTQDECCVCRVQPCEDNLAAVFSKEHIGKKHSLKAIYLRKNDQSFSVDITQLLSIRYFHVSKKQAQIWLQFIEGHLWGLSSTELYISQTD